MTLSAVVATYAAAGTNATIALGLSYAIFEALAFILIERARAEARNVRQNGVSVIYSTRGLLSQPERPVNSGTDSRMAVMRDVSMATAVAMGISALTLGSFTFGGLGYWGIFGKALGEKWLARQSMTAVVLGLVTVIVHLVMNGTLLLMVSILSIQASANHSAPSSTRNPNAKAWCRSPSREPCMAWLRLPEMSRMLAVQLLLIRPNPTDSTIRPCALCICSSLCRRRFAAHPQHLSPPPLVRCIMRHLHIRFPR